MSDHPEHGREPLDADATKTDSRRRDLAGLESILGHPFRDRALLVCALTHRSFANEHRREGSRDNERLEFLGDAVLDLAVGHMLMERYPALREGQLSVARAQVVSEEALSELAIDLALGDWLYLGKGERRSGGQRKPSILADAMEAVIAAVYLDGGFTAAWALVGRLFASSIGSVEETDFYDFKTRLQELAQAGLHATPAYRVLSTRGPDHAKIFEVSVEIAGREWARASGRSKKRAEQRAAANASFLLEGAELDNLD